MLSFHIATLGCKVNQYESQAIREAWLAAGLAESGEPQKAGLILVNSCAVTAKAVADVRRVVRRLHHDAPDADIIVTGCAAAPHLKELAALPGVVRVVPQDDKAELKDPLLNTAYFDLPDARGADGRFAPAAPQGFVGLTLQSPEYQRPSAYPDLSVSGCERSRAILKIQDGCSHGCAFCIVPLTRGGARSRPFAESLAEAVRLLEAGFTEIVISGVNLRQYRHDGKGGFWTFLAALDAALAPKWEGRARFRLSSLDPGQLGPEALETLGRCRMLAPHLHLSLQSGSASVLLRMGRGHYDPGLLPDFLAQLRSFWPLYGLGADILTGFPGESEAEFAEGMRLVRLLGLSYAHVFPYSPRPGTRAALMPGQLSQRVKKTRAEKLRIQAGQSRKSFLDKLAALPELTVVFEGRAEKNGLDKGLCEYYAECRLCEPSSGTPRSMSRVRPLKTDGKTLLVTKILEDSPCG